MLDPLWHDPNCVARHALPPSPRSSSVLPPSDALGLTDEQAVGANIVRVVFLVLVTFHLGDEAGQGARGDAHTAQHRREPEPRRDGLEVLGVARQPGQADDGNEAGAVRRIGVS